MSTACMRKNPKGALLLVSLLLFWQASACNSTEFRESPFSLYLPDCPESFPRESTSYVLNPKRYAYQGPKILSVTRRTCISSDRQTWVSMAVFELKTAEDASAFLIEEGSDWEPSPYVRFSPSVQYDEFLRRSYRAEFYFCLGAEDQTIRETLCSVMDILWARRANLVVEVVGEGKGHIIAPPDINCGPKPSDTRSQVIWERCIQVATIGPIVVGDDNSSGNEELLESILRALPR